MTTDRAAGGCDPFNDVGDGPGPGSTQAFAAETRAIAEKSSSTWQARTVEITERLMAEEGVSAPESLSVNVPAVRLLEGEAMETEQYRTLFTDLADGFEAQGRIAQAGALVAPLLAVGPLSTTLTGTDYRHHRHFAETAEAYRFDYVQTLNQAIVDHARPGAEWDRDYVVGEEVWSSISPFTYNAPGVGWALRGHVTALLLLGLWLAGLVIAVPAAVARMPLDPR